MKNKFKKIINFCYENVFCICLIVLFSLLFFDNFLWIGVGIVFFLWICCILNILDRTTYNDSKTCENIEIKEPIVKEYACLNKNNGKEYRLSIFYDYNSCKYRVLDMNNHLILESEYDSENGAKEHIKNISEKIVGLKIYNNTKIFS